MASPLRYITGVLVLYLFNTNSTFISFPFFFFFNFMCNQKTNKTSGIANALKYFIVLYCLIRILVMNERMIIFCNKRRAQPRRTRIITLVSSKLFFCLLCMLLLLFHYRIINVLSFSGRSSSSRINNNRRIGIKRRKRNSIIVRNNSMTNGLNLRNDDEIDENDDITVRLQKIRDQQLREAVLERLFLSNDNNYNDDSSPSPSSSSSFSSSFVSLSLVGQSKLPVVADVTSSTSATTVLVLHDNDGEIMINTDIAPHPVLFVPVTSSPNSDVDRKMKLVEHVYKNEPIIFSAVIRASQCYCTARRG